MSRFSGKCDCYDTLVMIHEYTDEELKNNVNIYICGNPEPLKIENRKDLIPYYPHLIGSASFDNEGRKATVYITKKPFTDSEEEERLDFYLHEYLKIFNRCKRKKMEFNVEDVVRETCWMNLNIETHREIANRVKMYGKKADTEGLHLNMYERYRNELVQEMLKNGLDPANYGYERFVKSKLPRIRQ